MYDVIIIGAGVSGSAIAMELSKYKLDVCVLEKEEDVCCGTSKANSGIVHAGFDAKQGSLMAQLNLRGNLMMPKLAKDLDIPFKQNGAIVVCIDKDSLSNLYDLYNRGIDNGVEELEIIEDKKRIFEIEPNLSPDTVAILYAKRSGIICPFSLNIAMAENACVNGVKFEFDTEVTGFTKNSDSWVVHTNNADFSCKYVVNAAGVYADDLHNMISKDKIEITARRGDYLLLDKKAGQHVSKTIFALPSKLGKGVLVSPTVHGNLLIGPTAIDVDDKDNIATTQAGIDALIEKASLNVKDIPLRQVITSFAGLRAHEANHEFYIKESSEGFIDCSGIESPGLTSSPAIGEYVKEMIVNKLKPSLREDYNPHRKSIVNVAELSKDERAKLINKNPLYGNIICRCEMISEGEIVDAINRPIKAKSIDAIKRRTRAGMGRCQSGFCLPRVMEIINSELNIPMIEISKNSKKSRYLVGRNDENKL